MKTLFDNIPLSHRNDPHTSYLAAQSVKGSGIFECQKTAVLDTLKRNNGSTSAEIADYMYMSRHVPARRLPDLKREGKVMQGKARTCKITKRQCVTWWVV